MRSTDQKKSEAAANITQKGLPLGMGYKSCWMVVEGATQKAVADAFLQGRKMKYSYQAGLKKVEKAKAEEKKLLVTAVHQKQNYVIGTPVSEFFYETEEFVEKCKNFPRVYVYMTHRVSETHGFAMIENGKLVRFFKYDENGIENIGEPLPEETALGYRLPKTFEDVWEEEGNFTEVTEDMLVELAIFQTGIDVEQYPYKDVKVGKRFEYSSELAKDPYPDENFRATEETRNLPEVQRFLAAQTYREKLEIVKEIKDELTHSMIDMFGEIIEIYAGYGRLSERTDELCSILQYSAETEEQTITQEEFFEELNTGNFLFEDKIFKQVAFEGISCRKLIFNNCRFFNTHFSENQMEQLEMNHCSFNNSTFSGKLQAALLILHHSYFYKCKIHDLTLSGNSGLCEMTECLFDESAFSHINIHTNFRISGGSFSYCTGDTIQIENCKETGSEEKPVLRENKFQNCYVNGKLQE